MEREYNTKLLRIFVAEADKVNGNPLYEEVVFAAKNAGISGATVLRGIMGYGADSIVHSTKFLELSSDLPLVIEVIDNEEKISNFIPRVEALFEKAKSGGLITLEKVEVLRYRSGNNKEN
ncbi:MAG: DUF190 domain-containing protein [Bacteroidota bacterium]